MSKADASESLKRTNIVKDLILNGIAPSEIVKYCEKEFNISSVQSYEYIKKARVVIKEDMDLLGVTTMSWHTGSRIDLMSKMIADKDYIGALKVLQDLAKLQGLYSATVVKVDLVGATKRMAEKYNLDYDKIAANYKEITGEVLN